MKTLHHHTKYLVLYLGVLVISSCTHSHISPQAGRDGEVEAVHRLAVTSATHIGFLAELGELEKVVAVTNKDLIYTPLADSVIDIGDGFSPNLELLVKAHVDAVLICSYPGNQLEGQLNRLGIRAIEINEWKETSPLKRAEWIKTFGDLLNCRATADSIYASVEERYTQLREIQKDHLTQSVVPQAIMTGMNYRGTWYVPSGNTFMGHLFQDAGAAYPYYDDTREESIPLTLEMCIAAFRDADIWVGSEAHTMDELAAIDEKHTWFRAFQQRKVYNWFGQTTPAGGNNFWERGVVHPEEILEDLISILNDSASSNPSFHFAEKVQ